MEGRRAGGREPEREKERLREVPREREREGGRVFVRVVVVVVFVVVVVNTARSLVDACTHTHIPLPDYSLTTILARRCSDYVLLAAAPLLRSIATGIRFVLVLLRPARGVLLSLPVLQCLGSPRRQWRLLHGKSKGECRPPTRTTPLHPYRCCHPWCCVSKHLLTRERADEPKRLNLTHMHCCLLCRCVFAWTWTPILPLVVFYLDKGACNIPKHAGQAERSDLRGSHWDNARLLPIISPVRYKTRIYPTLAFIYSCARGARVNNKHTPSLTANRNVCHCLSAPPAPLAATPFPCLATRYQYASFYAIVAEAI